MAAVCIGRKSRLALVCGLVAAVLSLAKPNISWPATSERIVVNRNTGLAIDGYDPVAYFTDGSAKPGRSELEINVSGAVWRFVNEGNRAAFEADPEIYTPQFGGYDPIAIARGASTAGHPQVWMVFGQRLYLFYNAEARSAFAADPNKARGEADEMWPRVLLTLAP